MIHCPISGCIVQNCLDADGKPIIEQYVVSTNIVDICIDIKNNSIYCDPQRTGGLTNLIENCTIIAKLLSPKGKIIKKIKVFPGQKKSMIARGVCTLEIEGEQAMVVGSCKVPPDTCDLSMQNLPPTCNRVSGSYEGTIIMSKNYQECCH
ncbi:hypothetical protein [Chengkuizengella marina]|nr:hypothetical protein [Chengkuizengella marina]